MRKRKTLFFSVVSMLFVFMIIACDPVEGENKVDFPVKKNKMPEFSVVMINDKLYDIKDMSIGKFDSLEHPVTSTVNIQFTDQIVVILPRCMPITMWTIDDIKNLDIKEDTVYPKDYVSSDLEGESPDLQRFKIKINDKNLNQLRFKWSNVDQIYTDDSYKIKKPYKDVKQYCSLVINLDKNKKADAK